MDPNWTSCDNRCLRMHQCTRNLSAVYARFSHKEIGTHAESQASAVSNCRQILGLILFDSSSVLLHCTLTFNSVHPAGGFLEFCHDFQIDYSGVSGSFDHVPST